MILQHLIVMSAAIVRRRANPVVLNLGSMDPKGYVETFWGMREKQQDIANFVLKVDGIDTYFGNSSQFPYI